MDKKRGGGGGRGEKGVRLISRTRTHPVSCGAFLLVVTECCSHSACQGEPMIKAKFLGT